ncbi:MAG: hypothetical protein KatS3mg111_0358 [Pirellulaceae bacterium]|nr:MAG: hypothetical protein KatS3mg111_0358 [Pirellulaceae bacterium]
MTRIDRPGPDGHQALAPTSRRHFVAGSAAVGAGIVLASRAGSATAAPAAARGDSETLVQQLYGTLTDRQKMQCCFSFDDPLRQKVDNNWHITKVRVGQDFNADQQDLIRQIFLGLHSEEYADKVMHQVEHDGGFKNCSIALFGQPGSGKFEFVLTGRHVTRRCDGDSVEGAAFGGPIFYGHAARSFNESPLHEDNVYWFQAVRANELYQALDGRQRKMALLGRSRGEHGTETVKLKGTDQGLAGIPVSELTEDQRQLARQVMADLLLPFREQDRQECIKLLRKQDVDKLHFSFYKDENIGDDEVWDVWQVEGPTMVWYFRGKPHVHTWVHIRDSA